MDVLILFCYCPVQGGGQGRRSCLRGGSIESRGELQSEEGREFLRVGARNRRNVANWHSNLETGHMLQGLLELLAKASRNPFCARKSCREQFLEGAKTSRRCVRLYVGAPQNSLLLITLATNIDTHFYCFFSNIFSKTYTNTYTYFFLKCVRIKS